MKRSALLILVWAVALAAVPSLAREPDSPLFKLRLETTLGDWERGAKPVQDGGEADPVILSVQPWSFCLGSACLGSYCLGSACVGSSCVVSACVNSSCLGSACAPSICAGSACLGTTLCVKKCGPDGGPPQILDPLPSGTPSCGLTGCAQP